jgi:hypothetical protein
MVQEYRDQKVIVRKQLEARAIPSLGKEEEGVYV